MASIRGGFNVTSNSPAWRCLRCGLVSNGPRAKHHRRDPITLKVAGPCGEMQGGYFVPNIDEIPTYP